MKHLFFFSVLILSTFPAFAQLSPVSMEDVMNFMRIEEQRISYSGTYVGFTAAPDRGDGFARIKTANAGLKADIERGSLPTFSRDEQWAAIKISPSYVDKENSKKSKSLRDTLLIIELGSGEIVKRIPNIHSYRFIEHLPHLMYQTTVPRDSTLAKGLGYPLFKFDLNTGESTEIHPSVTSFTADSLSTQLIYHVADTSQYSTGIYMRAFSSFSDEKVVLRDSHLVVHGWTWDQPRSKLAFMAAPQKEDNVDDAVLYLWDGKRKKLTPIVTQKDAREGYFLPFENKLQFSRDGRRVFFGFRDTRFKAFQTGEKVAKSYKSELDSLQDESKMHVWHPNDSLLQTHQQKEWKRSLKSLLTAVVYLKNNKIVPLADVYLTEVDWNQNDRWALGKSNQNWLKNMTWEGFFEDLYLVNLQNGERFLVAEKISDQAELSPDGNHLLYFKDNHWRWVNTKKKQSTPITKNVSTPFYNEDHDYPSEVGSYGFAAWSGDSRYAYIYDKYDIWRFDTKNRSIENWTDGKGRAEKTQFRIKLFKSEQTLSQDQRYLVEAYSDTLKTQHLYDWNPATGELRVQYSDEAMIRILAQSEDGTSLLVSNERYDRYPDLQIADLALTNRVMLTNFQSQLKGKNWGNAQLIDWLNDDGQQMQGVVITPENFDSTKAYPVLVYYYRFFSQRLHQFQDPRINHRPFFPHYISQDYIVFLPDIRFEIGRPGLSSMKSLIPGVQALISKGWADPNAIGLHGHSWSGYQTAFIVTQSDLFAAAVAGAPVSNMTSAYGGIRWGSGLARQFQYEKTQSRIGSTLWNGLQKYIDNSPLFFVDQLDTPLLLMHGDKDDAVPWYQSIELYLAGRRLGKDIIFLHYEEEPHHLKYYPNRVDYARKMVEYFNHHLKGEAAPKWMTKGEAFSPKQK